MSYLLKKTTIVGSENSLEMMDKINPLRNVNIISTLDFKDLYNNFILT